MRQSQTGDRASAIPTGQRLRLGQSRNPAIALGMAVSYLMTKPAFARLRFGDWSRVLVGQINRGHYCFVIDNNGRIQGFAGWALTTKEKAEAWLEGRRALSYEDSRAGDCLVFNAWSASSTSAHRFLFAAARQLAQGKQTVYFKRYYEDGRVRPARINVNEFVESHIARKASARVARAPAASGSGGGNAAMSRVRH